VAGAELFTLTTFTTLITLTTVPPPWLQMYEADEAKLRAIRASFKTV